MTIRRWATLSLLLFLNLIFGVIYIQPSRIRTFISYPTNDTELFTDSNIMTSFSNKSATNATEESLKKSSSQAYMAEITFPLYFNFTLNPIDLCSKETSGKSKLSLLVLVCTAVPNFKQRKAIRETWGSIASKSNNSGYVRLAFLLGATNDLDQQQRAEEEFVQYGDIIQQNFVDSYRNLTLKSVMLLKWVSEFCPNVQYVMKTDDDMYVNVANLVSMLVRLPVKSNVMYGVLFKKAKPNRNPSSKWFVPKNQFADSMFPDYLSGTGYVMSRDVVPKILEASTALPFMVMEDVFITGLCASESRVKRYNVRGFAYWRRQATACAFKDVITGHHVSITDMYKIWRELQKTPLVCRQSKKKL